MEKKRKEEALEVCLAGLKDPFTHLSTFFLDEERRGADEEQFTSRRCSDEFRASSRRSRCPRPSETSLSAC